MRRLQQRGDTIVEVLISLAVLSLVLGGAYSIVNSSLRASRQAQERSEANKLAESQIESLKSNPDAISGDLFCLDTNDMGEVAVVTGFTAPGPPDDTNTDTYTNYPPGCKGRNNFYNVFVTRSTLSGTNDSLYSVNVRWDRIGGGKEQLVMTYRGYKGIE